MPASTPGSALAAPTCRRMSAALSTRSQPDHARSLSASTLAVAAAWPAARPALTVLQFFSGPADAAFSRLVLLGVLDPADELIPGQGRDVLPRIQRRRAGDQGLAQVRGKLVHHPAWHLLAAHYVTLARSTAGLRCTAP